MNYLYQKYKLPSFISPYLLYKGINFDDFDNFDFPLDEFEEFESYSTEIAGRKYPAVSTYKVIALLDHLTGGQKKLLKEVKERIPN